MGKGGSYINEVFSNPIIAEVSSNQNKEESSKNYSEIKKLIDHSFYFHRFSGFICK
jgi:hypothetical protein